MTDKQVQGLIKAYKELQALFDHIVIIVADKERNNNELLPDTNLFWYCCYVIAKQMFDDACLKI